MDDNGRKIISNSRADSSIRDIRTITESNSSKDASSCKDAMQQ
jgi:hypothetical protein